MIEIKPYAPQQLEAIVRLSLRAWTPVFESVEQAMGSEMFRAQHPDWRVSQQAAVEEVCTDESVCVLVALDGSQTAGFAALKVHRDDRMGEIYMIAVDPDYQRRGIGAALTDRALDWFKEAGMTTVMVETGGDPGHGPARLTYEAAGFRVFPIARYFKKL